MSHEAHGFQDPHVGQRSAAMTRRHAHLPWRISRWTECGGRAMWWELHSGSCPHCPACGGKGYIVRGSGPHGDDPEFDGCDCCGAPLLCVRLPLPRSLAERRRIRRYLREVEPPF